MRSRSQDLFPTTPPIAPFRIHTRHRRVRGTANGVVYRGAVSWQQSQSLMYYAQASEGFRGPFGRFALPNYCAADAARLGSTTAAGDVGADELWNYELGAKTSWLADRLRVNAALYRINWTNIQQSIFLTCGYSLKENLGSVVNKGAEVEIEGRLTDTLSGGALSGTCIALCSRTSLAFPARKASRCRMFRRRRPERSSPTPWVPSGRGVRRLAPTTPTPGQSISTYAVRASFTPDKGSLSLRGRPVDPPKIEP